jgi:glucose/arabinose dehydrogenase
MLRAAAAVVVALIIAALLAQAQTGLLLTQGYASGFSQPVAIVQDPIDRTLQFVVEQAGRILAVRSGSSGGIGVFLDIRSSVGSGGERGLLGLAFAPDYATSRRFYVNFTDTNGNTVIARFRRSNDPLVAEPASRFDLRWGGPGAPRVIAQPFANHNGGHLAFGPDGFLYIGLGDGGSANDPGNRAQNPSELLGKMLRIDVNVQDSDETGYRIPPANPFLSSGPPGTRGEIWSFGLRNPWRYNFDDPARGGSGALLIADVGQGRAEEISYEPPNRGGRNYGWRNREGSLDNVTSAPPAFLPLINPIHQYDRSSGQSITGGYVYRGNLLGAEFRGRYFFADYVQGRVWSMALTVGGDGEATASNVIEHTADLTGVATVSSFGVDADGELFIVNHSAGTVLRVTSPHTQPAAPTNLRIIR